MTKQEFLESLRDSLDGQIPADQVLENLRYYRSYISDEMDKGRSEQEVLDELGDPRLIARTIVAAASASGGNRNTGTRRQEASPDGTPFREERRERHKTFRVNKWTVIGLLLLILFLIFCVLYFMFRTVFRLLFSFHGIVFWIIILLIILFLSRRK